MTPAGSGTREAPWLLKTPPGSSDYEVRDEALDPPALVVRVGKTELRYAPALHRRPPRDAEGERRRMPLGSADEKKPAADGTVEAWGARGEGSEGC